MEATLVVVGRTKKLWWAVSKLRTRRICSKINFEVMALNDARAGLKYLSYLPTLWMGQPAARKKTCISGKRIRWCASRWMRIPSTAQVDGEPLARLPVEFSIVPKALKLLVPRGKSCRQRLFLFRLKTLVVDPATHALTSFAIGPEEFFPATAVVGLYWGVGVGGNDCGF